MLQIVIATLAAFTLSALGVAAIRRWAWRHGVVDIPNGRSSHSQPTARGGGLAIVIVTLGGWWCFVVEDASVSRSQVLAYTGSVAVIGGTSWLDDLYSLPNRVRFAAHCIGAALAIWGFGYWQTVSLPLLGEVYLGALGLVITFLWLVGLTNAYNFMDGIDGIAGGQAVIAGLAWAALSWMNGQMAASFLGLLLAASSLGFLLHNWPPASIFMGDVGSTFLGYTLAVLPLMNE